MSLTRSDPFPLPLIPSVPKGSVTQTCFINKHLSAFRGSRSRAARNVASH